MKILILEDEIHNFHLLRHMLEELDKEYYVAGPITSVNYAIDYFMMGADVDIIIADIQLNDGLSFDALKYAPANTPVIFTTAYDQHALRAFEYNSLSYLLKPIDEDELRVALQKAKRLKGNAGGNVGVDEILADAFNEHSEPYRKRFLVKAGQGERVILIDSVRYIVSEEKTTYIKLLDGGSYPLDMPLDTLVEQLDPRYFMRVNRKFIIPLNCVSGTQPLTGGRERLILRGDNVPDIVISRDKRNIVNKWLEMMR